MWTLFLNAPPDFFSDAYSHSFSSVFILIGSNRAFQALLLEQALTDSGLRAAVSDENVELMNDFNVRLRVLQQLGYIDADRTVQLKGRVAAEVSTCDALIVTEVRVCAGSIISRPIHVAELVNIIVPISPPPHHKLFLGRISANFCC